MVTAEAKVGIFASIGIILTVVAALWLGDAHLFSAKGYTVYAGFRQVIGLVEDSTVRLSGVPVGTVKQIETDGGGVTVTLDIQEGVLIPQGSEVVIASSGVMGEKFVNIRPAEDLGNYLQEGDYIIGAEEATMDTMFDNMNKAVLQVQELLASMNSIMGDPVLKKSILEMSINVNESTKHIAGLTASLERISMDNEGNIKQAMRQLNSILSGLERTMGSVEHMAANMDTVLGDPQVAENMKSTVQNISVASEKAARIAESIDKVTGDPQTMEDVKSIIHNAKSVTERADQMMGKMSSIQVKPSLDVLYSGGADKWTANANLEVGAKEGPFMALGLDDIGEDNKIEAQVGKQFGSFRARAGVIRSKPGIGVDAYAGDRWKFSADAYDMNHAALRLRAQFRMAGNTYLMGQWDDVNRSETRKAYVGIRQEF